MDVNPLHVHVNARRRSNSCHCNFSTIFFIVNRFPGFLRHQPTFRTARISEKIPKAAMFTTTTLAPAGMEYW